MQWFPEHTPEADETVIVHGDYRMGNVLIHPTQPRIAAVLDWELSTLGHPLADLGYVCMDYHSDSYTTAGLADRISPTSAFRPRREFIADYCRFAGTRRDRELEVLRGVQPVPLGRDHSRRLQARPRRQREFRYRDRVQGCVPDALGSCMGAGGNPLTAAAPQMVCFYSQITVVPCPLFAGECGSSSGKTRTSRSSTNAGEPGCSGGMPFSFASSAAIRLLSSSAFEFNANNGAGRVHVGDPRCNRRNVARLQMNLHVVMPHARDRRAIAQVIAHRQIHGVSPS